MRFRRLQSDSPHHKETKEWTILLKKTSLKTVRAAAVLTAFSLICKALGMFFRLYLTGRIGSEGLGLYQLILSLYSLFSTFATSGFLVAVSRLAAEKSEGKSELQGRAEAKKVLYVSGAIALAVSSVAAGLMFFGAKSFSSELLKDARTLVPLKVLSLSMPFMALSACLKGYFIATRRVYRPAFASLFEQIMKIAVTVFVFSTAMRTSTDIGVLCTGIVIGVTVGEILSYLFLAFLYLFFTPKSKGLFPLQETRKGATDVLSVTAPIALSSYLTSALHTVESVLIPIQFGRYGGDSAKALSDFGMIRGMAIPALFFPFAFLNSLLSILVPELSRLNTLDDKLLRNRKVQRIMEFTVTFSIFCGGVFLFFPRDVSLTLYASDEATNAIRILALVTPFMYIETICDGLLKSIGEQMKTLKYGLFNSVLRICVILTLIPLSGSLGYLWLLVVSNTFSFVLCFCRLKKVTAFKLNGFSHVFLPCLYTGLSGVIAFKLADSFIFGAIWQKTAVECVVCILVFALLFRLSPRKGKAVEL